MAQEGEKKRKRPDAPERSRKKKAAPGSSAESLPDVAKWESDISKDPLGNKGHAESLFESLDISKPEAQINVLVGLSLCKIYVRLNRSGKLSATETSPDENTYVWYRRQFETFRRSLAELCKASSPALRDRYLQISWRLFQADADVLGQKLWGSDQLKLLLDSVLDGLHGGKDQGSFLNEQMTQYQDFYFYTLKHLS